MVTLMPRGAIHGELRQMWGIRGSVVLWASKVVVEGLAIVMPTPKPVWGSAQHLFQVILSYFLK